MMGVLAMVLSSCSKDIVKEVNKGTPIDFRAYVETCTKAVETTSNNLETFYATAISSVPEAGAEILKFEFFYKDVQYSRIGEYYYSYPTYYWPEDNRLLLFLSYSPSIEEIGGNLICDIMENEDGGQTLLWEHKELRPAAKIVNQVDYIVGGPVLMNKEAQEKQGGVSITMSHLLSQIEIRAKSNNPNNTYRICGIRIGNPIACGDLNLENNTWAYSDEKTIYEDTYNTPVTLQSWGQRIVNPASGNAMLIPQTLTAWDPENDPTNEAKGAYISVKLQIKNKNNEQVFPADGKEYGWVAVPISGEWKKGEKYVYTLDFTDGAGYIDPTEQINPGASPLGDKIILSTTLTGWEDKSNVEATNKDLMGHWIALKGNSIDSDDNIEHKYENADQVKQWLGEFYDFIVTDEHTIKIKNAQGEYNTPSSFNVENNYVLMDCFRNGNDYILKPYIQHIDETSAIIVNTYEFALYTRVQTIYYQRNPLEE